MPIPEKRKSVGEMVTWLRERGYIIEVEEKAYFKVVGLLQAHWDEMN